MHEQHHSTVEIASGEMTSAPIALHQFESALYNMPAGIEGAGNNFTFVGCTNKTGTFASVVNEAGAAITASPTASAWQPFRSELFGLPFVKLVNASAQTTARTVTISGISPRG